MENHGGIEGSSETYIVDMTTYRHIFGSDPLEFAEPPKISLGYLHVKRTLDVVVSLVAILMLFLPGLLIAAAVVATSKGPLFYRETRVGRNGLTFRIWKFRSMRSDRAVWIPRSLWRRRLMRECGSLYAIRGLPWWEAFYVSGVLTNFLSS